MKFYFKGKRAGTEGERENMRMWHLESKLRLRQITKTQQFRTCLKKEKEKSSSVVVHLSSMCEV